MARRPRWHHMVLASQAEALTAVELHNSPITPRPLESFLVHMHIAWLYLLHAELERDRVGYHYRDPKTKRYVKIDGERKSWDLDKCITTRWPDGADPVRQNLQLTVKLRNKVEHRWERGLMVAAYGFTQALTINYETEVVSQFGTEYSIADRVHLPVSLSTFSREGAAALAKAQRRLPKPLRDFFIDYRAGLSDELTSDRQFEFRIEIMQKRSPRSEADLAIEFVRLEDMPLDERQAYEKLEKTGRVIVRDKVVHVPAPDGLYSLSPRDVCEAVQAKLGWRFAHAAEFPKAWKALAVRPDSNAVDDEKNSTDTRYCRYDKRYNSYSYTADFIDLIVDRCGTEEDFKAVIGWAPKPIAL